MAQSIITLEGYDEITRLFKALKIEKEHWVEEKQIAAQQGDRSENAEYQAAKENIRRIDKQLYHLDNVIKNSKALDTKKRGIPSIVLFGSIIKVNQIDDKGLENEMLIKLVGTKELVYVQKVSEELCVSNVSPLGSQLLKKEVGDEIEINKFIYEIMEILG